MVNSKTFRGQEIIGATTPEEREVKVVKDPRTGRWATESSIRAEAGISPTESLTGKFIPTEKGYIPETERIAKGIEITGEKIVKLTPTQREAITRLDRGRPLSYRELQQQYDPGKVLQSVMISKAQPFIQGTRMDLAPTFAEGLPQEGVPFQLATKEQAEAGKIESSFSIQTAKTILSDTLLGGWLGIEEGRKDIFETPQETIFRKEKETKGPAAVGLFVMAGGLGIAEKTIGMVASPIETGKGMLQLATLDPKAWGGLFKELRYDPIGTVGSAYLLGGLIKGGVKGVGATYRYVSPTKTKFQFKQYFGEEIKLEPGKPFEISPGEIDVTRLDITKVAKPTVALFERVGKIKGTKIKEFDVKVGDITYGTTQLGERLIITKEVGGVVTGKVLKLTGEGVKKTFKEPIAEPLKFEPSDFFKAEKPSIVKEGLGAEPVIFEKIKGKAEILGFDKLKTTRFKIIEEKGELITAAGIAQRIIATKKLVKVKGIEAGEMTFAEIKLIPPRFVKEVPKLEPEVYFIEKAGVTTFIGAAKPSKALSLVDIKRITEAKGITIEGFRPWGKKAELKMPEKLLELKEPSKIKVPKAEIDFIEPSIKVLDIPKLKTIIEPKLRIAPVIKTDIATQLKTGLGIDLATELGLDLRTDVVTEITAITKPKLATKLATELRTDLATDLATGLGITGIGPGRPGIGFPEEPKIPITGVPTLPLFTLPEEEPRRRKKVKRKREPSIFFPEYRPSVEAIVRGIGGFKPPKEIIRTGLGLRPVVRRKRRKR